MTTTRRYYSVSDIRRHHSGHWFDPSSMRFFRSRVGDAVYGDGGNFFVSSEQFDDRSPRLYTVRVAYDDGSIDEVGKFQQYPTYGEAVRAAKHHGTEYAAAGMDLRAYVDAQRIRD